MYYFRFRNIVAFYQDMNMVGHDTPCFQVVTVSVEFKQCILYDLRAVRISQMTLSMSSIEQFMYAFQLFYSEPMLANLIIGIVFREFALKYLHVQFKTVSRFLGNGVSKVKSYMLNQSRLVTVR